MSSLPSRHSHGSRDESLHQRLAAYSRYVALVHAQEEAVDEGDMERFAELAEAREELQEELDESLSDHDLEEASADQEGRALLEAAMGSLRGAMARDERMRKVLAALRKETAVSIRTMGTRKGQVDSYLDWQEPTGPRATSRVNRKG